MTNSVKVAVLLASLAFATNAQDVSDLGSFKKLFENFPNFTTEMVVTTKPTSGESSNVLRFAVAQRNGVRRVEGDADWNSGPAFAAEKAAKLKAKGMSRMVMIANPTNKTVWVIFPALRGYLEEPAELYRNAPITMEKLGEEEIGGHPCVVNRIIIKGASFDGRVWNATDLDGFPIKLEFKRRGVDAVLRFENVSLTAQSEKLFRPPSDFRLYADRASLKDAAKRIIASTQ